MAVEEWRLNRFLERRPKLRSTLKRNGLARSQEVILMVGYGNSRHYLDRLLNNLAGKKGLKSSRYSSHAMEPYRTTPIKSGDPLKEMALLHSGNIPSSSYRYWVLLAIIFLIVPYTRTKASEDTPDQRLRNAHASFHEMMAAPDKGIPLDLFNKSECIVIIPGVKKAAFIFGGKYGRGFVSCRRGNSRRFGAPAAIRIEGGSYGLQIGGSSTDVFMLIMNDSGMNRLLSDKFTLGGEAAAAAGPIGRNTSAATDVLLHAEILTWSRSRGIFAGLSLEGSTLRPDGSENRKLYGRDISNKEILEGEIPVPPAGRQLIVTLNRYSGMTSEQADVAQDLRNGRVILQNVHFATGKADITTDSETALAKAAQAINDNPDWKIRVEGFTDSSGNKESNLKLSQDRADAVANWLIDHGVDRSRLTAKGYGEDRPIANNKTDAGRRKNRRVELVRV